MDRSIFLLITAIVSAIFGLVTFVAPANAAKGYGITSTPEVNWLFRILGAMVLSAGILNFMVRDQADSIAIQAILVFNIVFYFLRIANDIVALRQKLFPITKIWIGELVHLFISFGSLGYLLQTF